MVAKRPTRRPATRPNGVLDRCRGSPPRKPKGWGANQGRDDKVLRARLLGEIALLDNQADTQPFSEQEWAHRYALEGQVEALLRSEEEYWRRRGGLKWTLKGDANTGYFHAYANGCRRKCLILRL